MPRAKLKKHGGIKPSRKINPYDNNSVYGTHPGGGTCCCPPGCFTRSLACCGSRPVTSSGYQQIIDEMFPMGHTIADCVAADLPGLIMNFCTQAADNAHEAIT